MSSPDARRGAATSIPEILQLIQQEPQAYFEQLAANFEVLRMLKFTLFCLRSNRFSRLRE